jgi:glycerophosphoryl diester phosphodiesterase
LPAFVAHRFGRAYGPDSSSQALDAALAGQVEGVETDCCLTADGHVVLLHDPLLDRSVSISGWAADRSLAEIKQSTLLDSSGEPSDQHPLELMEFLERVAGEDLVIQLEIKSFSDLDLALRTAERVCDLVTAQTKIATDRVEVISFWPEACALAASAGFAARPIVACAYAPDALAGWASDAGLTGIILEAPYFSDDVVSACSRRGLSVMSGVVNQVQLLKRILRFEPVAVSCDRPRELRAELESSLP